MNKTTIKFLTGPVEMYPDVKDAFLEDITSHRSEKFIREVSILKEKLCALTKARHVELISGSGTIANEIIASHLSTIKGKGLILSNGEFGERLILQAGRFGLDFNVYRQSADEEFDMEEVKAEIRRHTTVSWIWFVHCETSTGILNPPDTIIKICEEQNIKLCVDCISSIGNIPVDMSKVFLASASSNKGLGAFPGIALVFYNTPLPKQAHALPAYFDLDYYRQKEGIPFTISTHLVSSLNKALSHIDFLHFENIAYLSAYLSEKLTRLGFRIIGKDSLRNPAVFTVALPPEVDSYLFGNYLLKNNIYASFESHYLREMNRIQISLMGNHTIRGVNHLIQAMDPVYLKLRYLNRMNAV